MSDDRVGTLGSVNVVLPHYIDGEERYRRMYKPVTPASRIVTGADDAIAPETDIASWAITDWSGGEGDLRWRDRGRYRISDGVYPDADGNGIVLGHEFSEQSAQAATIHNEAQVLVARDMDDTLYSYSAGVLSAGDNIGGTAGRDAVAIVDGVGPGNYTMVLDNTGELRRIGGAGNNTHDSNGDLVDIVLFADNLYGMAGGDLYHIDETAASTRTKTVDTGLGSVGVGSRTLTHTKTMTVSDVGPVWVGYLGSNRYNLNEYNYFTDTWKVLAELPDDIAMLDVAYYNGIYFVLYRNILQTFDSPLYLWYLTPNGQPGSIGPIGESANVYSLASFVGLSGARLLFQAGGFLWAYDLSDGAVMRITDSFGSTKVQAATLHRGVAVLAADSKIIEIDLETYEPNAAGTLSTGRDDYGYPGLAKLIHTVTVATEDTLAAAHTVEVGYSVDGGSTTWLSDDFATGEGSHTWTVSTNAASVIGTEVEWHLRLTSTTSASSPKVVGIYSDASGARSRIEWAVAVDVDRSSTVEGEDVISALNGLKTTHAVVQWSDPFQVGPYDSAETFDVRVLDVSTPEYAEGEGLVALVKFQTVGVVGG